MPLVTATDMNTSHGEYLPSQPEASTKTPSQLQACTQTAIPTTGMYTNFYVNHRHVHKLLSQPQACT